MGDAYKVQHLKKMLAHEESKIEVHYGAHLKHWYGDANELTIDAGGLRALIKYYQEHNTELGNEEKVDESGDKASGCNTEEYNCDACPKNGDCVEQGIDGQPRWMENDEENDNDNV